MKRTQALKVSQSSNYAFTLTGYMIVVVMAIVPFGMIIWKMFN